MEVSKTGGFGGLTDAFANYLIGLATPGWMTTVIGTSLILMLGVVILSFVGLALSILAGTHTIPTPGTLFQSFIVRDVKFGPSIQRPQRANRLQT